MEQWEIDRVIEMAWEDRTPFEAIEEQFGLSEADVIKLMRAALHRKSWERWRQHVQARKTKHRRLRGFVEGAHKSRMQRQITLNKLSKRK